MAGASGLGTARGTAKGRVPQMFQGYGEVRRYLGRYHGRRLRPPPPSPQLTLRHLLPSLAGSTGHQGPGSTVPPTMEPNMSRGDKDEDEYEEEDWVVSLRDKGKSVFKVLCKDKIASSHFFEILTTAIESQKLIWMHENTIDKMGALEREYANDVASLKDELEEEQTTKEALEETFALELSREKENHDRALEVANELKLKNDKLVFVNAKLLEDFEQLKKGSRVIESALTKLTESHEQLKASYLKEHDNLPSPITINNDACATNSTSCEASILKENVELRAQLKLLTSNYGKLEENHGKLASSHEDLLASHDRLKLAHEAIISKATPCSTSSSTCVVTNHVEEIKELKAQVSSLKNDLVKGHEGKCKLDKMLSVQQSPNDKSGLGFNSNNKNKSKNNKIKKGQLQVKDPAKIVCFKCKIEGHHVRSCPLKKKQKGKRPQAQTHIQPQVEEMPLPKKNQANAPIVEKSSEKKEKKRTCYICREKGHISSFCTIGTSSNSITIDDVYSLRIALVDLFPTKLVSSRLDSPISRYLHFIFGFKRKKSKRKEKERRGSRRRHGRYHRPHHGRSLRARYRPRYRLGVEAEKLQGYGEVRRYPGRYHGRRLRPPPPSPQLSLRRLLPSLAGSTGHQGPVLPVPSSRAAALQRAEIGASF
ncbi:hypothetical protein QYE76_063905 [Lolium multiflorum]|uniref:CCHC-type domain-containing protein n=1 Tax=Lolium multiflorum TaxID=4521 RepID=A0AAD8W8N3_LOLMU|nr:hypothetical protein QYE76_063905 [Lolium multiflorum]